MPSCARQTSSPTSVALPPRVLEQRLELVVGVVRVVVEQHRLADLGLVREADDVLDARVPPADVVRVLVVAVLRVVQQHVRAVGRRRAR